MVLPHMVNTAIANSAVGSNVSDQRSQANISDQGTPEAIIETGGAVIRHNDLAPSDSNNASDNGSTYPSTPTSTLLLLTSSPTSSKSSSSSGDTDLSSVNLVVAQGELVNGERPSHKGSSVNALLTNGDQPREPPAEDHFAYLSRSKEN